MFLRVTLSAVVRSPAGTASALMIVVSEILADFSPWQSIARAGDKQHNEVSVESARGVAICLSRMFHTPFWAFDRPPC